MRNNLAVLSFAFAAIGFVFIIVSLFDIKSASYQYYTGVAFALLVASFASGAIAKRRARQAKAEK